MPLKYIFTILGLLFILSKVTHAEPLIITTSAKQYHFDVEIADTPEKSARGLMFRNYLPENAGMIFISPKDQIWAMWMKNTLIPLDILFFDRNGRITKIVPNAIPFDLTSLSSDKPVAGALEINGGICQKYGISTGDSVSFTELNKD